MTTATKTHAYRCGHSAKSASPLGGDWLYDCEECRAKAELAAKARIGWKPGPVYTVIGELGNSDGAYTREMPSLAAALEAIRTGDLPFAPASALCYEILEHEPLTESDPVTGWRFGGIHHGHRRSHRVSLTNQTVIIDTRKTQD